MSSTDGQWTPVCGCVLTEVQTQQIIDSYSGHLRDLFVERIRRNAFDEYQLHPDMREDILLFAREVFGALMYAAIGTYLTEQLNTQYKGNVLSYLACAEAHLLHQSPPEKLIQHTKAVLELVPLRRREVVVAEASLLSPIEANLKAAKERVNGMRSAILTKLKEIEGTASSHPVDGQCYGWVLPSDVSGAMWLYQLPTVLSVCSRRSKLHTSSSTFIPLGGVSKEKLELFLNGEGGGMRTSMGEDVCQACHQMNSSEVISEDPDARSAHTLPTLESLVSGDCGIEKLHPFNISTATSLSSDAPRELDASDGSHKCLDCATSTCVECNKLLQCAWTLYKVVEGAGTHFEDAALLRQQLLALYPHFTHATSGVERFTNLAQTRIHRPGLPVEHRMLAVFALYQHRPAIGVFAPSLAASSSEIADDYQPPFRDFTTEATLGTIVKFVSTTRGMIPLPRRHPVRWATYGQLFTVVQSLASTWMPLCTPVGEEPSRFGVSISPCSSTKGGISNVNLLWHVCEMGVLYAGGCAVGLPPDWTPTAIADTAALAGITALITDASSLGRIVDSLLSTHVPTLRQIFVVSIADEITDVVLAESKQSLKATLEGKQICFQITWLPVSFFSTTPPSSLGVVSHEHIGGPSLNSEKPLDASASTLRVLRDVPAAFLVKVPGQVTLPTTTPSNRAMFVIFSSGTSGTKAKGVVSREGMYLGDTLNSGGGGASITAISAYSPAWATDKVTFWTSFFAGGRTGFIAQREMKGGVSATVFDAYATYRPNPMALMVPVVASQLKQHHSIIESTLIANGGCSSFQASAMATTLLYLQYLGGRINGLSLGGAKVPKELVSFFNDNVPVDTSDGMGTTETGGVFRDGRPDVRAHIKLIDRAALGYSLEDKPFPRGEVAVRVTSGKVIPLADWVADEETKTTTIDSRYFEAEDMEQQGDALVAVKHQYILTGDIASLDPATGHYKVVDRVSAIRKMAHGRFFSPEEVEAAILEPLTNAVLRMGVSGLKLEHCVVDLSSDEEATLLFIRITDPSGAPCMQSDIETMDLLGQVQRWCSDSHINSAVVPRSILYDTMPEGWTAANGCLTHTSKVLRTGVRRNRILQLAATTVQQQSSSQKMDSEVVVTNEVCTDDMIPLLTKGLCGALFPDLGEADFDQLQSKSFHSLGVDSVALGQMVNTLTSVIKRVVGGSGASQLCRNVAIIAQKGAFVIPLLMTTTPLQLCTSVVSYEKATAQTAPDVPIVGEQYSSFTTPLQASSPPPADSILIPPPIVEGGIQKLDALCSSIPGLKFSSGALLECGYGAVYLASLQSGIYAWWSERHDELLHNKKVTLEEEKDTATTKQPPNGNNILLTGATGFLGVTTLRTLLERLPVKNGGVEGRVICIVRGPDATARLLKKFQHHTIDMEVDRRVALEDLYSRHVLVVEGDISTDDILKDFPPMAIDSAIHCAATIKSWGASEVNLTSLVESNVLGTLRVALLVLQYARGPGTRLSFISTEGVINSFGEIVRRCDVNGELAPESLRDLSGISAFRASAVNPYNLSKFTAESSLRKVLGQLEGNVVNLVIYRPPLLTWDSTTGYSNEDDWCSRLLDTCIQSGISPTTCPGTDSMVSSCPVDKYAQLLVDEAHYSSSHNCPSSTKHDGDTSRFRVGMGTTTPLDLNAVNSHIAEVMGLHRVPSFAWVASIKKSTSLPYSTLLPTLGRALPKNEPLATSQPVTDRGFMSWVRKVSSHRPRVGLRKH